MSANQLAARRTSRKATLARIAAVVASVAMVSMLIVNESRAAFTATTDNTGNSFTAASITLTDNDSGAAMFTVANMLPGDVAYGCITVTYTGVGVDPDPVLIYSEAYTDTGTPAGDLGQYLDLVIKENVDAGTCDGTLTGGTSIALAANEDTIKEFAANVVDYSSGVGTWDPTATGQSQRYQFIVTLSTSTPDAQQAKGISGLNFTWETQAGS